MIKYTKGIFGLNLLFRVHGSAIYRAVLPAILAAITFILIYHFWDKDPQSVLLHPYAAGVLIGGITFLLVFRVTQSYGRYWEATGAVYKMQSKWMDSTIHTANYHMQHSIYDDIRPPSYREYHYLNEFRLTRARERVHSSRASKGTSGKMSSERAAKKSIESVGTGHGDIAKVVGMVPSEEDSVQTKDASVKASVEFGVIPVIDTMLEKAVPRRRLVSRQSSRRFESAFSSEEMRELDYDEDEDPINSDEDEEEIIFGLRRPEGEERPPKFLTGQPKVDGGWGVLFDDGKSTYMKPHDPKEIDHTGFASIQGGRTPVLFLQELAHLSSLLNAVALSTLRNDTEGVASPLSLYIPGSAWPAVDPKWDENVYDSRLEGWFYAILFFLGATRSPSERAKYNIARPLPVLGGVSDAEIQMLKMARGPLAKTQLCWQWLSELAIREHSDLHGALLSRAMQFMSDGMVAYNDCRKIMFNPFPFPFAQMSSFFVNFTWILVPLLMYQYIDSHLLGVLLSFASVMCLQSIDEVGKELENPFRNIPNELPVVTYQAEYNEALLTMYSGFHPDSFWKPPREYRHSVKFTKASSVSELSQSDLSAINESRSNDNASQGDSTVQPKEPINEQMRLIIDQQNQMMDQMIKEQKRLNDTLQAVLLESIKNKDISPAPSSEIQDSNGDESKNQ